MRVYNNKTRAFFFCRPYDFTRLDTGFFRQSILGQNDRTITLICVQKIEEYVVHLRLKNAKKRNGIDPVYVKETRYTGSIRDP